MNGLDSNPNENALPPQNFGHDFTHLTTSNTESSQISIENRCRL